MKEEFLKTESVFQEAWRELFGLSGRQIEIATGIDKQGREGRLNETKILEAINNELPNLMDIASRGASSRLSNPSGIIVALPRGGDEFARDLYSDLGWQNEPDIVETTRFSAEFMKSLNDCDGVWLGEEVWVPSWINESGSAVPRNVVGRVKARENCVNGSRGVVLIDNVMNTGKTMLEALIRLNDQGVKVSDVVVGVLIKPGGGLEELMTNPPSKFRLIAPVVVENIGETKTFGGNRPVSFGEPLELEIGN